jgi:hypothetical protein
MIEEDSKQVTGLPQNEETHHQSKQIDDPFQEQENEPGLNENEESQVDEEDKT